ncbi:hypothetical protein OAQ21_03460 [Flavobacteriales bacterium]|nr:hypothetical protein [Flavobacteriales bacterium]
MSFTEYLMLGAIFSVNIILNRTYGTASLGEFNVGYSLSQIIILGFLSSFSPLLRREITINVKKSISYVSDIFHFRIQVLVLIVFLSLVSSFFFFENSNIFYIFIILATAKGFDLLSDVFYVYFQSVEKFKIYAILKSSHAITLISVILTNSYLSAPIEYIYISFLVVSILFFLINVLLNSINKYLVYEFKSFLHFTKNKIKIFHEVWPLIINSFLFQLKSRINVVIIFTILGAEFAGVFAAVVMTISVFTALSSPLGIVIFPKLNKTFVNSSADLPKQMRLIIFSLLAFGFVLMLTHFFTMKYQILLIGDLPSYSSNLFSIMSISIPFMIAIGGIGNIFVIIKRQKELLVLSIGILMLSVLSLFVFIHFFNNMGAAISFSFISVFHLFLMYTFSVYFIKDKKSDIK